MLVLIVVINIPETKSLPRLEERRIMPAKKTKASKSSESKDNSATKISNMELTILELSNRLDEIDKKIVTEDKMQEIYSNIADISSILRNAMTTINRLKERVGV